MADENDAVEGAEGAEGEAASPNRKKLLIIIIAAVVAIGGGVGGWLAFGGKHDAKGKGGKEKVEAKDELPPRYVNLDPPFVVNFEADSAVRFLQVTVGVMTRDPAIELVLKDNDPRVRNDLLLILGNQTYQTVSSREGRESLRVKCLEAVRAIVKDMHADPTKVEALYFTSFVMQ